MFKTIGTICVVIGGLFTAFGAVANEMNRNKKMDERIDRKVNEKFEELKNEEEDEGC